MGPRHKARPRIHFLEAKITLEACFFLSFSGLTMTQQFWMISVDANVLSDKSF